MSQKKFKVNISRVLALLLAATLLYVSTPAAAAAGGSCGSSLEWSFEGSTLSITGSGAMTDYSGGTAPWYQYRDSILRVSLPSGLTHIGKAAFYDCVNVTSVTLPSSVETIGEAAFYRCSSLTMLSLNSGLRSIGRKAFQECSALTDLRLPGTLKEIGNYTFYMCSSLNYVTVPSSVTSMGSGVFAYCDNLIRVDVEAAVDMSNWSFYGCDQLQTVTVQGTSVDPDSMKVTTNAAGVEVGGSEGNTGSTVPQTPVTPQTPQTLQPSLIPQAPQNTQVSQNPQAPQNPQTSQTPQVPELQQSTQIPQNPQQTTQIPELPQETTSEPSATVREPGEATSMHLGVDTEGNQVIEVVTVEKTENATTVSTLQTPADNPGVIQTTVSSTIQNDTGWQEVLEKVDEALTNQPNQTVTTVVHTPHSDIVAKEVLQEYVGKNVILIIQTQSGSQFKLDCSQLPEKIKKDLNLSYTLILAEQVPEGMEGCTVYLLTFEKSADFQVEMIIRLPGDHGYQTAILYRMDKKEPIQLQRVMVDAQSNAHWYLRSIDHKQEYLIGINIPGATTESPIIPAELAGIHKVANVYDGVEYVVTGRSSSWNMGLGRVMAILAAVMVSAIVVIGFVMFSLNKRRLKNGYMPDWSDEDEE